MCVYIYIYIYIHFSQGCCCFQTWDPSSYDIGICRQARITLNENSFIQVCNIDGEAVNLDSNVIEIRCV